MQHCKAVGVAVLRVRELMRAALVIMMNNAFALFIYSNHIQSRLMFDLV